MYGAQVEIDTQPVAYVLGTAGFMPTQWVFGGRRHCCLICAHCVTRRGGGGYVRYIWKALGKGYLEHHQACMLH